MRAFSATLFAFALVSAVGARAARAETPVDDAPEVETPAKAEPAKPATPAADSGKGNTGVTSHAGDEAPGPDDMTVEVDQSQSKNRSKSLPLAMLCSAILPGTGEYYLDEKSKAKAFLLTEAGFWASLYAAFVMRDSYLQSARNYASQYAGIDASNKSAAFLETMADFRSYQEKQHRQDSYELAQQLSGKRDGNYDIPATPDNYWDFGSSVNPQNTDNWKTFQSTLRYYRASKIAVSFAVGALALNRLASLANTLTTYKRTSAKGLGLQIMPGFGPGEAGAWASLRF